jgi:hypothetical protein
LFLNFFSWKTMPSKPDASRKKQNSTRALIAALSGASSLNAFYEAPRSPVLEPLARQEALDALAAGADPDATFSCKIRSGHARVSALISACASLEFELAAALINAGADPNLAGADVHGRPITALWACARNSAAPLDEIERLMRAGADAFAPASDWSSFDPMASLRPAPCATQWFAFLNRPSLARLALDLAGPEHAFRQLLRYVDELRSPQWAQSRPASFDRWGCDMLDQLATHPVFQGSGLKEAASLARCPQFSHDALGATLSAIESACLLQASASAPHSAQAPKRARL